MIFVARTLNKNQGNVQLPNTPLPPGQVGGVAVGDPPRVGESPPALEVGSQMTQPSPASTSSSFQAAPSKRVPGKLALCKFCGTQSEDLSTCTRCKRKFPDDVKLLDDPAFKQTQKPDSTDSINKNKALRGVRLPSKNRKRNNLDEPVCIALSDSEEDGEEDLGDAETIDDESGNNIGISNFARSTCGY